ncbi:MAG: M23 family metallopeptidase [Bacteroidetes bacterium]|jgi:murein DD-endopeptidase MepM/ murein hydrolase activator NlpD|nr:MAG: M23 family metallopeptidase [Bacteroidota bacterium]
MAKEIRYYYDEASCSFLPVKPDFRSVLKRTLYTIGGAALASSLIIGAVFFFYDSPKEALLKKQNAALISKINELDNQFASLEDKLNELHTQDNSFYRSLLGAEKVDDGQWNGGVGGAEKPADGSTPEALEDAQSRIDRLNYKIDVQNNSYNSLFDKLSTKEEELRHVPAIKPVAGMVISGFGMRMHPILKFRKMHTGLDMEAAIGTTVYATADGVVITSGTTQGGYGLQIEIKHGNFGYTTKYAHLSRTIVSEGQEVKRGQVIGYTGNSGQSKGPHLHYEIIKEGSKIDPIDYFYGNLAPKEYIKHREDAKAENVSMD